MLNLSALTLAQHASIVITGEHAPKAIDPQVRENGWRAWHAGPWTTYSRQGRTVSVGYLDDMGDQQLGTLFDREVEPLALVGRLHRFGQAISYAWTGTASTTALHLLRLSWENVSGNPLWKHSCPIEKPSSGALIWGRDPSRAEAEQPSWSWDVNGMYLAAASGAEVAFSGLDHTGTLLSFDPQVAGYWLVTVPSDGPWAPPVVDEEDLDRSRRAWVTTPVAQWLQQRHGVVHVHDSWTAREGELLKGHAASSRVFRRWADILRDARAGAGPDIGPAVKRTYAAAVGGLRRETMPVHRPDWSHTVIDLARVNMLRRVHRVYRHLKMWPVRVNTDEVTYRYPAHLVHLLEQHLGVGDQLGAFKRTAGRWS